MRFDGGWLLAAGGALLFADSARAQALFEDPRAAIESQIYVLPEQCVLAAVSLRDSLRWGEVWDTVGTTRGTAPLPTRVIALARQCGMRFPLTRTESVSLPSRLTLALIAGEDSLAGAIVERQVTEAGKHNIAQQSRILLAAINACLDASPIRLDAARAYAARVDALDTTAFTQMRAHAGLVRYANAVLDTALLAEQTPLLVRATDRVPPSQRLLGWPLYDGLGRASALVLAILRGAGAGARAFTGSYGLVGQTAPAIHGDYWFGSADSAVPQPVRGTVSLIFIVNADPDRATNTVQRYALLRRLKARFPELNLVVVTRTNGYFLRRPPPPPEAEAVMDQQFFLQRERLAAIVSVSTTPFTRMSEPDGRWVAHPTANDSNYKHLGEFQDGPSVADDDMFLVDRDGRVVFEQVMDSGWEAPLTALIQRLLIPTP